MSADKMKPTLTALIESLKRHHYSYEVIGLGRPWGGFKTKMENYLQGIQKHLAENGPDSMVIFVDAFDVLCIKDAEKLMETYKQRPRKMPIVVGAEIYCFFKENCDMRTLEWFDANQLMGGSEAIKAKLQSPNPSYYESPSPVFLNSGFIMGPAKDVQDMFQGMMDSGLSDDQNAAIDYMVKNMGKIDIDIEERLVRNKLKPREKLPDEDGIQGPGFVHYPGTRNEKEQAKNLSEYYTQYPKN
jgi:hypothetical protein